MPKDDDSIFRFDLISYTPKKLISKSLRKKEEKKNLSHRFTLLDGIYEYIKIIKNNYRER